MVMQPAEPPQTRGLPHSSVGLSAPAHFWSCMLLRREGTLMTRNTTSPASTIVPKIVLNFGPSGIFFSGSLKRDDACVALNAGGAPMLPITSPGATSGNSSLGGGG